ncbi:MAG TPA: hypothetical protein VHU18_04440 [Rhizomicrobium sp.]|jgi:hypothetical protein|nr:hypothetical protein [Rhizomicrobium sp.]
MNTGDTPAAATPVVGDGILSRRTQDKNTINAACFLANAPDRSTPWINGREFHQWTVRLAVSQLSAAVR